MCVYPFSLSLPCYEYFYLSVTLYFIFLFLFIFILILIYLSLSLSYLEGDFHCVPNECDRLREFTVAAASNDSARHKRTGPGCLKSSRFAKARILDAPEATSAKAMPNAGRAEDAATNVPAGGAFHVSRQALLADPAR